MKSGKVLMKILPMSLSSQSATLRVKWLKGHRCFMSFLIRGGLSGFSVMSRSPGRLSIMSSEQQVWYWVVQGLGGKKKGGGSALLFNCVKVMWKSQENWHLPYGFLESPVAVMNEHPLIDWKLHSLNNYVSGTGLEHSQFLCICSAPKREKEHFNSMKQAISSSSLKRCSLKQNQCPV